jgi:2-polyprenyl-3-methyl-5-hydroxy-6-metoxy-1,4-benzoquinol methylase
MIKDSDFYNKESGIYSSKRYPAVASTYIQFFFKKRLDITITLLKQIYCNTSHASVGKKLLEVGCADGVVVRAIQEKIPNTFSEVVGIDIAPDMVKVASELDRSGKAAFYVRGQEPQVNKFDAVVEIGVANYTDFDAELAYTHEHLVDNGVFILSIAGNNSLSGYMGGDVGYENFLPYPEYEKKIAEKFIIERVVPVGLRLPIIWKIPTFARCIQPVLEVVLRGILGHLFHEKVYMLKKR